MGLLVSSALVSAGPKAFSTESTIALMVNVMVRVDRTCAATIMRWSAALTDSFELGTIPKFTDLPIVVVRCCTAHVLRSIWG